MGLSGSNVRTEDFVKVLVPASIQPQNLYLSDGRVFTVVPTDGTLFRKLVLREDDNFWTGVDDKVFRSVISVVDNSLKTEADNCLDHFVSSGAQAIDSLAKTTLQELRRKLIESSAGQLKLLFEDFFTKNTKHITEVFSNRESDGVIKSTGPIPKAVRFRWEMKKGKDKFSIYCLELPPHKRHIMIKNQSGINPRSYNWVMPWLCILVAFKDDNFWFVTAFYRNKPLDAEDNGLMKCGLPGKQNNSPWCYCVSNNNPAVRLSDPEWVDKLLTWFFDSVFMYHDQGRGFDDEFTDVSQTVRELKSFSSWENFSNSDNALQKVCKIKFPLAPMNLQQYVVEIMGHMSKEKAEEPLAIVKEKELIRLAERFEQTVKEKFVFLAGKTVINAEAKEKTKLFFIDALNSLKTRMQKNLEGKLKGLGALIKQNLVSRIQQSEKKGG